MTSIIEDENIKIKFIIVSVIGFFLLVHLSSIPAGYFTGYFLSLLNRTTIIEFELNSIVIIAEFMNGIKDFILVLCLLIFVKRKYPRFIENFWGNRSLKLWNIVVAFSIGIALASITIVTKEIPLDQIEIIDNLKLDSSNIIRLVIISIIYPFIEETIFRGLLFQVFLHSLNLFWASLISALFFMIYHINFMAQPLHLLTLFFIGIIFAILLYRAKSVTCCIIAHMTYNVIVTGRLFL